MMAGDVYGRTPHAGRAGWSWYTGSAAWMYRAAIENVLGLRRRGAHFSINPCIPSSWPGYEITWRVETTRYVISVSNPGRLCRGVVESSVDGVGVNPDAIPLVLDGGTHQVRIRLGQSPEAQRQPRSPNQRQPPTGGRGSHDDVMGIRWSWRMRGRLSQRSGGGKDTDLTAMDSPALAGGGHSRSRRSPRIASRY